MKNPLMLFRTSALAAAVLCAAAMEIPAGLKSARDAQDLAALDALAQKAQAAAAANPASAGLQYQAALAENARAEVALELRDRNAARAAAEAGIRAAERAVALQPGNGEYHRILGALCGQVIPANVLAGMRYGRCALEEVNKAAELAPKSALAWLSRGVGNYYLPPQFGGGAELALKDIEQAIQLNGKDADAHLWRGIVLRRLNRNAEARRAFERSLELNPARVWAKQQLDKTPPQ
jgi:tetratricopeptide (TPR) repeat protein